MKKLNKYILLPVFICLFGFSGYASMNVIEYIAQPAMNEAQLHYYNSESSNPVHENIQFALINMDAFNENTITLELDNYTYTFEKEERNRMMDPNRQSWIGKIPGSWADYAHFVVNRTENIVVGHVTIDGWIFAIRPLSGGLHLVANVNDAMADFCGVAKEHHDPPTIKDKPLITDHPDLVYQTDNQDSRATGECLIRVMIIFTDDADAALADILADINNQFNIANTGYQNNNISMRIEMAACYEVFYTEVDLSTTLNDVTNGNGVFSDADLNRGLWRADQVAVIMSGGGGLAWVSLTYGNQHSVTGINNFSVYTFHHELGHNALCTHDLVNPTQPGTAPYAGWGEPTTNCFRTVLAYQPACGGSGCPRHNVFSDNTQIWNCGGTNYTAGTINNRNEDRLNLSDGTILDFEIVLDNELFSGDYNWFSGEAVHRAANLTISYNSTVNNFELFSGSEGSFRASNEITLGEGFWARSGSVFTAYRESCTPTFTPEPDDPIAVDKQGSAFESDEDARIAIAPNPFSSATNINYFIDNESLVDVRIYNIQGALLTTLLDNSIQQNGNYTLQFDGSHLSAGTYFCIIKINDQIFKKSLVLSGH
ncbi:MAG: T9SS type A sorting domain-containing protein [Chitinophagales bacterium]|nr:T9SS type A sorting domain-containing protein [Chitinophagales bacterium]